MQLVKDRLQRKPFRLLLQVVTILLVLIPLLFLFKNIWNNWQQVIFIVDGMEFSKSIISFVFLILAFSLLPLGCQYSFSMLGYELKYRSVFQKHFISQLSKYLPGGVWIVAGRVMAFQGTGVDVVSNSASMIIEMGVMVVTGTLNFIPYLILTKNSVNFPVWVYLFLMVPMLFVLYPPFMNHIVTFILQSIGYKNRITSFSFRKMLPMVLIYMLFWLLVGCGFYLLVTSISSEYSDKLLQISTSYSMAWVIGFLAFLSPGGLGIREGALNWILIPIIQHPLPSVIALVSRLWWSLAELFLIMVALLDYKFHPK